MDFFSNNYILKLGDNGKDNVTNQKNVNEKQRLKRLPNVYKVKTWMKHRGGPRQRKVPKKRPRTLQSQAMDET